MRGLVEGICAVACPEDGLAFDLDSLRVTDIRADEEYVGKRVSLTAILGKARINLQVDVGIGDAVGPTAEEVEIPVLLSDLPAPRLRAYRREESLAEKFEAMIKLDVRNSRMKDFHDVWALSESFQFDGPSLRQAVARCFERRGVSLSAETPRVLTNSFYKLTEPAARWQGYLSSSAVLVPPPTRFEEIGERVAAFLGPVREAVVRAQELTRTWTPSGPWQVKLSESMGHTDDA